MVEGQPEHESSANLDGHHAVARHHDGDLAHRSERQHRHLGLDDDRFGPQRVITRRTQHREGPAHQVVRRQLSGPDSVIEVVDATRERSNGETGGGVHDRHQHPVIVDGSNESEVHRSVDDQFIVAVGRVEELELAQCAYRGDADQHLVRNSDAVSRRATERVQFGEDRAVRFDRDEAVRRDLRRYGHVLAHPATSVREWDDDLLCGTVEDRSFGVAPSDRPARPRTLKRRCLHAPVAEYAPDDR